jgi:hypothetical protein
VEERTERIVEGRVRDARIWTIRWGSPEWLAVAGEVGRCVLPRPDRRAASRKVPRRLGHHLHHRVGRVRVAAIGDLLATKLKVVVDRPALRDYFDLLTIERAGHRYVEEGLALFLKRYHPRAPLQAVTTVVRALGTFGDVPEDTGIPMSRSSVERYWSARIPQIAAHLDRLGLER